MDAAKNRKSHENKEYLLNVKVAGKDAFVSRLNILENMFPIERKIYWFLSTYFIAKQFSFLNIHYY